MKLIVLSPESADPHEHSVLVQLFAAGLTSYHLRKPQSSRDEIATWLRALPLEFHARIVLHSHHGLAGEFKVGGIHNADPSSSPLPRSRAIHDPVTLRASLDGYDRLLVSPIFPSFSKPGHGPSGRFPETELRAILTLPRRAEVIALGGVDASHFPVCRDLGFDGVAVLGAVWRAADPRRAFHELQNALHAHAT